MSNVNKQIIVGRLGQDPDLRTTGNGKSVCLLNVAASDGKGDNEHTEWFKVVVWERAADECAKRLSKGDMVYVEGRTRTRSYKTSEGEQRRVTEVVAAPFGVQFLVTSGPKEESAPDPDDDIPF